MRLRQLLLTLILFCSLVPQMAAQNLTITGTVTDAADGTPMTGVTVYDPVSGASALTDLD